jgi:subtilisin family serine protease
MKRNLRTIALLLLISLVFTQVKVPAASAEWQTKVDEWVLDTVDGGQTEFIVYLNQQADLSRARELNTKAEKGDYVYDQLTNTAQNTQGPLLEELDKMGVEYRSYWIANMVWVRADAFAVQSMAQRLDVAHIYANPKVQLDLPDVSTALNEVDTTTTAPSTIEWNISWVGAPQVWTAGYSGQGVVVAGQDTGYEWDHPALINQYRGWDGSVADHNYNWHDAMQQPDWHGARRALDWLPQHGLGIW